jgi:heptosyltransferase-2
VVEAISSERVLIMTEQCLGDAVMTLPLIELLETRWPKLSLLSPGGSKLVLSNPSRTFMNEESARGLRGDILKARQLRKERFDVGVVAKTSFRAAWIARLAGIPKRVGHAVEGRTFLLTDPVPYSKSAYYAFSMLDLARPLGFTVNLNRPHLMKPDDPTDGLRLLGGATVGIQPGAANPRKRLPMELLVSITQRLYEQGFSVALLGGRDEEPFAKELRGRLDHPVVDLVGKTDGTLLRSVLSGLKLVVGADTGVLHFAAALGATTVQVFGPTEYKGWGNAFGSNQVIVAPNGDVTKVSQEKVLEAVNLALESVQTPSPPQNTRVHLRSNGL